MSSKTHWCSGKCGLKEVCSDRTYREGYCLEPKLRDEAVKKGVGKKEPFPFFATEA